MAKPSKSSKANVSNPGRTRAVAYLRVSTDKQADSGVSLDAQRAKLEAYASLYDLEIVATVVDAGLSAKTLDREGLQRALGMLESGDADALIVVKLDRLTRKVADLGSLVERYFAAGRWALLSVGEQVDTRTAAGRMVLNVLGAIHQWEREAIAERVAEAMAHLKATGRTTGQALLGKRAELGALRPDGSRTAGALVDDDGEALALDTIRELRASGRSIRSIAAELNDRKIPARGALGWHPTSVARVLARTEARA